MATTPVFLPGESYGQRNVGGYSPWGHKESQVSHMTDRLNIEHRIFTFFCLKSNLFNLRQPLFYSSVSRAKSSVLMIRNTVE